MWLDMPHNKLQEFVIVDYSKDRVILATIISGETGKIVGYVKGAFTDVKKDKPGRFALAKGRTILLDEIDSLSQAVQVKL